MDPLQLEMFVTTKDCDSVYKAAMLLKIAPTEVQHSLESLEQQTGAKLFFKTGSKLRLTCEGQILYLKSLKILDSWYIAQALIHRLQESSAFQGKDL